VRAGDWAIALEALIEALRADRGYAAGAARDATRAIFVLLGPGHPVAEQYHRAFSSVLHA
jgi:thioredoxin-like negative regulator of GroEL